jgi:Ca2+-binding EF-hand superfamily protein
MGEYRPPVPSVSKPANSDDEFQQMLAMIGEKVRQKFSKARDVFRFVDTDHSGTISRGEVHYFFRFFNVDTVQADKFFSGFESDEDDEISYVEFVKYLWPHINPGNEQIHWALQKNAGVTYQKQAIPKQVYAKRDEADEIELPRELVRARVNIAGRLELRYKNKKEAFRDLDYDRDGEVTQSEMRHFFHNFGWEQDVADKFYEVLMARGHGYVRFDTFARLFTLAKDSDLRFRL